MNRIAAILAVAAGISACKQRAPALPDAAVAAIVLPDAGVLDEVIRVQQIGVEAAAWPGAAGPQPEDRILASRVWEGLSQSSHFEAVGRRPLPDGGLAVRRRRAKLRAVYGVETVPGAGKSPGILRGMATLTIEWLGDDEGPELWSSIACDADLPRDAKNVPPAAADVVDCAIGRSVADLVAKDEMRRGPPAALLAALDDPDPSVRQVALAAIGERRLGQAVPRLIELLHAPDELVRDGAIGALVALRDRRAVKALTQLAAFKDLDLLRRVIDAIGAIGGDEAHAYLELVATGHEVPIIRELAQKALERMDRRTDGGQ